MCLKNDKALLMLNPKDTPFHRFDLVLIVHHWNAHGADYWEDFYMM